MLEYELDIDLNVDDVYGLKSYEIKRIIINIIKRNFSDVEINYITHNEISNVTSIIFNFKSKNLYEAKLSLLRLYVGENEFENIKDYEEAFEDYVVNDAFENYE